MINVQDKLDTLLTFYTFNIPIKLFKKWKWKVGKFCLALPLSFFANKLTYKIIYSGNTMDNKKHK